VRLKSSPTLVGWTTGKTKRQGPIELIEVEFPGGPPGFKPASALEQAPNELDLFADFHQGRHSGPRDLKAAITIEKLRGNLTELVYSMGAGRTDFYPHQFKPVLQFVKSALGRILIADEVGLGKTIEALYIWKELQVRDRARRLLVVCPSMLVPKWIRELENAFGIEASAVDAQGLLEALRKAKSNPTRAFALVASLEGIRPPRDYDSAESVRAELARLLDENPAGEDEALLDLVVIDEAHYLRNRETASNRLGQLLRDAARRLVMLTATPIQLNRDNLFQLLHLADPEEFPSSFDFEIRHRANLPLVAALRRLRSPNPNPAAIAKDIEQALSSPFFGADEGLTRLKGQLHGASTLTIEQQIEAADLVESRSVFARHMTRSRKREVLKHGVKRASTALMTRFSDYERSIYRRILAAMRSRSSRRGDSASNFALITRQRQMASSLPAALAAWSETDLLDELIWEDRGLLAGDLNPDLFKEDDDKLPEDIDLKRLEAEDAKYGTLLKAVREELRSTPDGKIVVFAYFKPTLRYLERRLASDGIRAILLTGGMGAEKEERLETFAEPSGPNVLLSSEVASEGVDLQFARVLVNYDLPWNPMRVEQRIGRLDRLGQKAEKISILNLFVENTVEEIILYRLYDRIEIFKQSIGDIEEILGEVAEELFSEIMSLDLTDEERIKLGDEQILSAERRIADTRKLQDEAQDLLGLGEFVLDRISEKRDQGDWIRPEEVQTFIVDALGRGYPASRLEVLPPPNEHEFRLVLCPAAKSSLLGYLGENEPDALAWGLADPSTRLSCLLGNVSRARRGAVVDAGHPLVRWLRTILDAAGATPHAVVACRTDRRAANLEPGLYAFLIESCSLNGIRKDIALEAMAQRVSDGQRFTSARATAVRLAAEGGRRETLSTSQLAAASDVIEALREAMGETLGARYVAFQEENGRICNQREASAINFADRKRHELEGRIERANLETQSARIIPALRGQIRALEHELELKLDRIRAARVIDYDTRTVALGALIVE